MGTKELQSQFIFNQKGLKCSNIMKNAFTQFCKVVSTTAPLSYNTIVSYPDFFFGIPAHISTVYLRETEGFPPCLEALTENVLQFTVSRLKSLNSLV